MLTSLVFITIGAFIGISQSAGIGGGPILNICLMMGLHYQAKQAMALTYIFLMGGSLASIIQNYPKKKKNGYPLMDYQLIQLTLPMTLSGSIFGVMLNHFMSDLVITVFFTILLIYLSHSCYIKYKQSTQDIAIVQPLIISIQPKNQVVQSNNDPILQLILENEKSGFQKQKLKVMLYAVIVTIALLLFRGSRSFNSILGIEPCGFIYWLFNLIHVALCYLFAKSSAIKIFKIQQQKQKLGYQLLKDEKMTQTKFYTSMFYGFIAGLVGGGLGLGGAIILVPVWLNNKIDKQVATSSSPPLIFLSSFISFFVSAISGKYRFFQFIQYFTLSFFSALFVKWVITYMTAKYKLKSIVYILLLFTMGISLVALLPYQFYQYKQNPSQFVQSGQFC